MRSLAFLGILLPGKVAGEKEFPACLMAVAGLLSPLMRS
jgi:hypothetical protein